MGGSSSASRCPRWRAAGLVCLAFAATSLAGAVEGPGDAASWHGVRSEHFTFVGDEEPAALEALARALESMRSALERLAPGLRLESPAPIAFYTFRDTSSYTPFATPGAAAGYLLDHPHGVYGAFVAGREPTRKVYTQYLLVLLNTNFPRLPPWLLYGLAELYATFEWSEGAVVVGLPNEDHLWLLGPLARAGQVSLTEVVLGDMPADPEQAQYYLAHAWALVHSMTFGDATLYASLASYVERLDAGEGPRRAFHEAFGGGPEIFDAAVSEYVQAGEHSALRIAAASTGPPLSLTELSRAETLYRQGDLLLHALRGRADSALAHLDRALELDPSLAAAWVASGHALEDLERWDEALARYRTALELEPDSYLAGTLLGTGLLRGLESMPDGEARSVRLDEAIRVLEACTRQRPDWVEAWTRLGFACSLDARQTDCAARATERALELTPGRTDLLFNLLLARARRLDRDGVAVLVAQLESLGARDLASRGREMELQLALRDASEAMREDRLADAVALLARVRAETTLRERREQADDWLERVARVEQQNRFAARYNQAVKLFRSGAFRAAAGILAALESEALPGLQQAVVRELDRALEATAFEGGVVLEASPESGDGHGSSERRRR